MQSINVALLLSLVFVESKATPLSEDQQHRFLSFINRERAAANSTMNAYVCYNEGFASEAEEKVAKCPNAFAFDGLTVEIYNDFSTSDPITSLIDAILQHKDTKDVSMPSCNTPSDCAMYKAIVAFPTTSVGCAIHECPSRGGVIYCTFSKPFPNKQEAFSKGEPCSLCGVLSKTCDPDVNLCTNSNCAPAFEVPTTTSSTTTPTTTSTASISKPEVNQHKVDQEQEDNHLWDLKVWAKATSNNANHLEVSLIYFTLIAIFIKYLSY